MTLPVLRSLPAAEATSTVRGAAACAPLPLLESADLERLRAAVGLLLEPGSAALDARLASAVEATLAAPGSLWRAQLAWAVGRACGLGASRALDLACAVESFHTASLLFDDLPSMDDGTSRRGRPCVHRLHGEAAATLAALALVHRGYALLGRGLDAVAAEERRSARELVEEVLGLAGILDGQARDVHFDPAAATEESVVEIARGKTVSLLRLALVLPAIAADRGSGALRGALEVLADSWGLAYQILDDLGEDGTGPAAVDARRGRPNLALVAGRRRAEARLERELERSAAAAEAAGREDPELAPIFGRLQDRLASSFRALPRAVGAPARSAR